MEGSSLLHPSSTEDVCLQWFVTVLRFMVTVERDPGDSIPSRKMLWLKEGGGGWVEGGPSGGAMTMHEPLLG